MSRAAVFELISQDAVLQDDWGILPERVYPTFGMDGSRNVPADQFFIILRWEEMQEGLGLVETLTVWVHKSRSASRDYLPIRHILLRIRAILENSTNVAGGDGLVMSQAKFRGMGPDNVDDGYDTITKYAVFTINGRA